MQIGTIGNRCGDGAMEDRQALLAGDASWQPRFPLCQIRSETEEGVVRTVSLDVIVALGTGLSMFPCYEVPSVAVSLLCIAGLTALVGEIGR